MDGEAALEDLDDGAVGHVRGVLVADGLLRLGIEGFTDACHGLDTLGLEQRSQLAVDGGDALHPGGALSVLGDVLDSEVEVIGHVKNADEQAVAGDAGRFRALLLATTLEVLVIGAGALPAGLGLDGPLFGGFELLGELLDLRAYRGALGVECGDALLGTGTAQLGCAGLGFIGPTRMAYPHAISTVRYVRGLMNELVDHLYA